MVDPSYDPVSTVGVFPYLATSGITLAARHVAEAARVPRGRGLRASLDSSDREDAADRWDVGALAAQAGLIRLRNRDA